MESTPSRALRIAAALSGVQHPVRAAEQACEACAGALDGRRPDLVVLFVSSQHVDAARGIAYLVQRRFECEHLIGMSAEAVVGGEVELENAPGISLFAASLPGVTIHPFRSEQFPANVTSDDDLAALAAAAGMNGDHRGTLLFGDPFSVPVNTILPALSRARPGEGFARAPILGGLASSASRPGGNVLFQGDRLFQGGLVGVSLGGNVRIDPLVSQGCRPFGPVMVVTQARNQIITQLGGRSALAVLHESIEALDEPTRQLLRRGVFLGRAVSEYKDRFGRGDFLIRNIVGVDKENGAIAVADLMRVGQTVQFHMRHAATASEDLALLLDGQKLHETPAGVLLFTCNGRGTRLFDAPNHDASAISRAFLPNVAGEQLAKGGEAIPALATAPPLAGCFAAGEIGPIGEEVFLHGQTACAALFRPLVS